MLTSEDIQRAHRLDRNGLVLLAMLSGGDYHEEVIRGCGASTVKKAIRTGLADPLARCQTQYDCISWRNDLMAFLKSHNVPANFPDIKVLNKYRHPKISSEDQPLNLRGLRDGWDRPLDEIKLLDLTSSRFDYWGKEYLNWIAPILLTRFLVSASTQIPMDNPHQIKIVKKRPKKDGTAGLTPILEREITFSSFKLTTLTEKDFDEAIDGVIGKAQKTYPLALIIESSSSYLSTGCANPSLCIYWTHPHLLTNEPPSGSHPATSPRELLLHPQPREYGQP